MNDQFKLPRLLLLRLERISADSHWAHRASGVRGALLRMLESSSEETREFKRLVDLGFQILQRAAQERAR
jgi:hypothetical protein